MSGTGGIDSSGGSFVKDPSLMKQSVELNRRATFSCPVSSKSGKTAICTFYDPDDQDYVLFGRQAKENIICVLLQCNFPKFKMTKGGSSLAGIVNLHLDLLCLLLDSHINACNWHSIPVHQGREGVQRYNV